MANINKVSIKGSLPFDMAIKEEVIHFFAGFSLPTWGYKLTYTGKWKYKPNKFGGQTAMYEFIISGEEAYWQSNLKIIVEEMKKLGAELTEAFAWDIENEQKKPTNLLTM